jgi:hypothetical protein
MWRQNLYDRSLVTRYFAVVEPEAIAPNGVSGSIHALENLGSRLQARRSIVRTQLKAFRIENSTELILSLRRHYLFRVDSWGLLSFTYLKVEFDYWKLAAWMADLLEIMTIETGPGFAILFHSFSYNFKLLNCLTDLSVFNVALG